MLRGVDAVRRAQRLRRPGAVRDGEAVGRSRPISDPDRASDTATDGPRDGPANGGAVTAATRILAVTVVAMAIVVVDQAIPLGPARAIAGYALTLVLPGLAVLLAFGIPIRPWGMWLAVPYSLALLAFGGIVTERLGLGLHSEPLLAWSLAVTLGGAPSRSSGTPAAR